MIIRVLGKGIKKFSSMEEKRGLISSNLVSISIQETRALLMPYGFLT